MSNIRAEAAANYAQAKMRYLSAQANKLGLLEQADLARAYAAALERAYEAGFRTKTELRLAVENLDKVTPTPGGAL